MADWTNVAKVGEILTGTSKLVYLDDVKIAVFHLDDGYYAIEDLCTHDGGELANGDIDGDEIICQRHGARFNIKTGEVTAPPAYEDVYKFPLREQDGFIQICDDRWD